MTLGDVIKKYRKDNKLSQRAFAALCDVTGGYISMLENNTNPSTGQPLAPSILTIQRMAKIMGVSLQDLFEQIDDMEVNIEDVLEKVNAPTVVHDERTEEFVDKFKKLDERTQKMIIRMMSDMLEDH